MLPLQDARTAALDDLDRAIATLEAYSGEDWRRPTPVAGRSLLDTARHLDRHCHLIAGLLARAVDAKVRAVQRDDDIQTPGAILEQLHLSRDELRDVLARVEPDDLDVEIAPTPQIEGPTESVARMLAICCLDIALHRVDIESALGVQSPDLRPEVARAADIVMGEWLPQIARASAITPAFPWAIHLAGDRIDRRLGWTGSAWTAEDVPGAPVTTVMGTDTVLALYLCGRIPHTDPRLRITGPAEPARTFSRLIPGP